MNISNRWENSLLIMIVLKYWHLTYSVSNEPHAQQIQNAFKYNLNECQNLIDGKYTLLPDHIIKQFGLSCPRIEFSVEKYNLIRHSIIFPGQFVTQEIKDIVAAHDAKESEKHARYMAQFNE